MELLFIVVVGVTCSLAISLYDLTTGRPPMPVWVHFAACGAIGALAHLIFP